MVKSHLSIMKRLLLRIKISSSPSIRAIYIAEYVVSMGNTNEKQNVVQPSKICIYTGSYVARRDV